MSHRLGSVINQIPPLVIGPGSGTPPTSPNTWQVTFSPPPAAGGTKFLMLRFTGATLGGGDRLEVDLLYDTDVFTAASGPDFWTRPIRGNSVTIRYIDDGGGGGQVTLSQYGRGEGLAGGGATNTNADLFLLDSPYVSPTYFNANGVCPAGAAPSWENVDCLLPGVMRDTARSVGMLVMTHGDHLSSCSAALIDPDLILTAGHCASTDAEIASASFTLDYKLTCARERPAGYDPKFHKVKRIVKTGYRREPGDARPTLDYSIIQIVAPPGGLGVPPLPIRASAPALGEELFIIHHPRGVPKKVSSQPTDPNCRVLPTPADPCGLAPASTILVYSGDSDNGSSGSPVFDALGRIVAVNDWACGACDNEGQRATSILQDFLTAPPPVRDVDVVLVFDRSGSMSLPGLSGATKIQEARPAAALFIDLLRTDRTHRAALVSFSTTASSPADFAIALVNAASKTALIGPPPAHNTGVVGGLTPGGMTTIGGGLRVGQQQLPPGGTGANTPAILLLTDGLQNTPPMIADVEPELLNTKLCIIGFGTEASLDGPLLTRLARDHGGMYTRAGDGLELKKFFVLCFGNIFETGVSIDPFFVFPAGTYEAAPIPLNVCGESRMTVVLGWERAGADLRLALVTPGGGTIDSGTPGVTASLGDTWAYLRLELPFGGERDGAWQIRVSRPRGDVEFPAPAPEERFFVTSIVDGGPWLRPLEVRRPYYTGETINPKVMLLDPSGAKVKAQMTVDVQVPGGGTGNLLARAGLRRPTELQGDSLDARAGTLIALEQERTGPLIPTTTHTLPLYDDGEHGDGAMEPDGVWGNPLADLTRFEGNYTFRARAVFGEGCTTAREASWSVYVSVGIDPAQTEVRTEIVGTLPDGRQHVRVTFTPRDRYGNFLGPGRLDAFEVHAQPGSDRIGGVTDAGDGSYVQDVAWEPGSGLPPRIVVTQPGRPPMVVAPPAPTPGGLSKGCLLLLALGAVGLMLLLLALWWW